jgi:hypothetical protein
MTFYAGKASQAWEVGAKAGFDTNVNRSVHDEEGDWYVGSYAQYSWEPVQESRFTWNATVSVDGTVYEDFSDLNCVVATIAPGAIYRLDRIRDVGLYAFLETKGVRDEEQSALTLGGKVNFNQQWGRHFCMGAYYLFADSHAEVDTYSFTEHALGGFLGVNWPHWSFCEIGYEFADGDSFRAVETETETSSDQGANRHRVRRRYSQAFETDVIRESVYQQTISADVGFDLTASYFLWASYSFTTARGDLGTSTSHSGFVGISYAF